MNSGLLLADFFSCVFCLIIYPPHYTTFWIGKGDIFSSRGVVVGDMGSSPDPGSLAVNIVATLVSFTAMAFLFRQGWRVSSTRVWRFNAFGDVTKADWCARWGTDDDTRQYVCVIDYLTRIRTIPSGSLVRFAVSLCRKNVLSAWCKWKYEPLINMKEPQNPM